MTGDLHRLFERLHGAVEADAERAAAALGAGARAAGARVIAVSACLLGEPCRWDGRGKLVPAVEREVDGPAARALPLCPEVLGGMGCPRRPVRFARAGEDGRRPEALILDDAGEDRSAAMARGAARADRLAELAGAAEAVLKERSPSCGLRQVGGPTGPVPGSGTFAARLARRLLSIRSEEDVVEKVGGTARDPGGPRG